MGPENFHEVVICSMSKLFLGGGERTIRVLEVSDNVLSGSVNDRLVEKAGVSIPCNRPVLFVSVSVVGFILSQNGFMLKSQILLDTGVLLVRWALLELENLVLNSTKLVRNFRFSFAPPIQIFGKVKGFEMERTVGRPVPTLFGSVFIIIFKEPPIFKFKSPVTGAAIGTEHSKNRSMITLHHR